ncbi:DUF2510 domain-containing protein [Mycobacterium noviomagense]|uniref:DUF2510 domain-containing protein n=2 Tax=Mycobacterium noviomagense TaxID=459858 RepID=A0A7I7P8Y2_9MYCO|nr:DUF2510 domain-containing protein [Mycobacterium noviomagense]ORB11505.1 hypothetical protein BST37_19215 [Mycobacterium noviomagense]BBY05040.1 hypothetical protein MNVI_03580 [Mycobacterium noviomagense]
MTTSTQPGWYDDPQNSSAQRYWDGQNWTPHRQRKNTTPPERYSGGAAEPPPPQMPTPRMPPPQMPPPASPPQMPPPLPPPAFPQMPPPPPGPAGGPSPWDQVRPYLNKARDDGRRFWSRQPRQRKIIFAVAGAVVAVAAIALSVTGGPPGTSGGGGSRVDTSSQSYQMGLKSGTDGPAEMAAFGYDAISGGQPGSGQLLEKRGPVSHQEACEEAYDTDNSPYSRPENGLNKTDYIAGCLYGLDHNANSQPTAPRTVTPPTHK